MSSTQFQVTGMTCEHCVRAVTAEVGRLDGVIEVDVDLVTGQLTVESATDLTADVVRDAVQEAGYELA